MPSVADYYRSLDRIIAQLRPTSRQGCFIDYAHRVGDVLYHGTVSLIEGVPRSTWTYEDGPEKVTRDQPIDIAAFDVLRTGLTRSELFARALTNDMDAEINPDTHHIIGVIFPHEGSVGRCLLLVPTTENDPEFLRWLKALNVPRGRSRE